MSGPYTLDTVLALRSEELFTVTNVKTNKSIKNVFHDIDLPQHPFMATNNWNSPHQDSNCSESVSLCGPDSNKLKLTRQYNPYGFSPCMVTNKNNQFITVSFSFIEACFFSNI